jgi:hypothetical protein
MLSPLASTAPDGLEKVAEEHGFIESARSPFYHLVADYLFPGIANEAVATIIAGLLGTALVFGLALSAAWLLKARRPSARP